MKLKSITFIFENCDTITIDGKYVGHFVVDNIKKSILRIAMNAIDKIDSAHTFVIEIHKNANVERFPFNNEKLESKETVFKRLSLGDITHIEFELIDRVEKEVCSFRYVVDWKDSQSEYINAFQKSYVSDPGHLYIVIEEKGKIEKYFDLEQLNDEAYMDFHFGMMDVG